MQRRTILKQAGAAMTVGALAGCLSDSGSPGGAPDDTEDESTPTETSTKETTDETTEETTGGETTTESNPSLQNRSVEIVNAGCADGNPEEASVEFNESESTVLVTGTIRTSDPCHVPKLGNVNYDRESGTMNVTIRAKKQEGEGVSTCQQCLGAIEYESEFAFSSGVPSSVSVSHQSQGETKEVTSAGHGSGESTEGT
ncbi:hypothetical protein [Haladaptatus cibarius]|uniref:hypothetical protein n=1 Tax=Haladaptatus cibarius TaxID=453847 RepID=UPI000679CEC7|nr:hypothetical protein [Haladaptatus cibarius]